jgi:Domain of unknown function (DUF4337)
MSADGFHVHGPHDHELEHAAQHAPGGTAGQLAVITAVLATVGAMFSYMGGATQADAGLFKNDAAIKKTEASNQWNYYQAKSSKQNLSELAQELAPDTRKTFYADEVKRYKTEKAEIKVAAEENAPAPPLGAGHHGAANRHRNGRDCFADQEQRPGKRRVRLERDRHRSWCARLAAHLRCAHRAN